MNINDNKNILLIDDHPLIRSGIAKIIEESDRYSICAESDSYEKSIQKIKNNDPDMIILDLHLEGKSGFDVLKYLKNNKSNIPVLIVSMHDEPLYVERVFKLGAKGYLLKRESNEHIVEAIRRIFSGRIYVSQSLTENVFKSLNEKAESDLPNPDELLSKRELEVFKLIGDGIERYEIAELLNISKKTVETHIERIKNKLCIESSFKLTYRAIKHSLK